MPELPQLSGAAAGVWRALARPGDSMAQPQWHGVDSSVWGVVGQPGLCVAPGDKSLLVLQGSWVIKRGAILKGEVL